MLNKFQVNNNTTWYWLYRSNLCDIRDPDRNVVYWSHYNRDDSESEAAIYLIIIARI